MPSTPPRVVTAALDGWVTVVAGFLVWPLLVRTGYPFARDLVFTPKLPLRPETLGLGTSSPRAAPLDAIVAVASTIVDGGVLAKVLVPGALLLAGWGAHRLASPLAWPARMAVAGFAVWNPFVVERLGLGQWALLYAYAALFWMVPLLSPEGGRGRQPRRGPVAASAPWLAIAAITPTGAVLAGSFALAVGLRRGRGQIGRNGRLILLVTLVQLPWLVPAALGGAAALSDPAGVSAFAARSERPGPAFFSLAGLGGIWDRLSAPGTRSGVLGFATSIVVVVAVGLVALRPRRLGLPARLLPVGIASLLLAGLTSLPGGAAAMGDLTSVIPGLGLLRDAQKWLAAFVVLAVLCVGLVLDHILPLLRRAAPAVGIGAAAVGVGLPWLLLPDGMAVVHRVVQPQSYPPAFEQAARVIAADPGPVITLPWSLYRVFPWAGPYATYDPASRWFDAPVVTDDTLRVGSITIGGEDPVASRVGTVVQSPSRGTGAQLSALGVRYIVVYTGVQGAVGMADEIGSGPGVQTLVAADGLSLLQLPGGTESAGASTYAAPVVAAVDLAVLLAIIVASTGLASGRRRDRSVTLW